MDVFFEHTFREFVSKTIAAGLPNHQTQDPPIHFSVLVASPALIVFLGGGLVKIIWSYFCLPSSRCGTRLRTPLHIDPSIRDVLQARCPVLEDHGSLTAREREASGTAPRPEMHFKKAIAETSRFAFISSCPFPIPNRAVARKAGAKRSAGEEGHHISQ